MSVRDSCYAVSLCCLAVTAATAGSHAVTAQESVRSVDFQRDIRPILADNCFLCHGPDQGTRRAGLRLDTREGALGARPRGAAVVPADLEASLLYQRITHSSDSRRMPPPALSDKTLSDEQIGLLTRWIEEGASWDQHWSFEEITRPEPPAVADEAWTRNPLDRFVLARLEAEDLQPAPEADRRAIARRVALDLTGLPPDPGTLASFLSDTSEGAYEGLVDRLLDSRHWGEHRARYWLDAARYGDTHGIHIDNYREMYAYRDWVIAAFNSNQPFDEFTLDQVAGDLLPEPSLDQLVATGFQRNNITTNEGGVVPEEYEAIYAKDRWARSRANIPAAREGPGPAAGLSRIEQSFDEAPPVRGTSTVQPSPARSPGIEPDSSPCGGVRLGIVLDPTVCTNRFRGRTARTLVPAGRFSDPRPMWHGNR